MVVGTRFFRPDVRVVLQCFCTQGYSCHHLKLITESWGAVSVFLTVSIPVVKYMVLRGVLKKIDRDIPIPARGKVLRGKSMGDILDEYWNTVQNSSDRRKLVATIWLDA